MIGANVARRYAKALIELGQESGNLGQLVNEIGAVASAIAESPELHAVIENPEIARAARKAVLLEIAERLGLSTMSKNTLGLLADHNRLRIIPALAVALRDGADRRSGVVRARVTSAVPLSDDYVARLSSALEARFHQKVVVESDVDPNLLAGVVTRVGDTVIDGTLKTRLDDLKHTLLAT